jgi:phosphoribosylformylglycinamidine (FGAM) synthase PurS component
MDFLVEIGYKNLSYDVLSKHLEKDIKDIMHGSNIKISTFPLYKISGYIKKEDAEKIAQEFLCDSVIQNYNILDSEEYVNKSKNKIAVDVWLKNGVTDTVASEVERGIKTLGISNDIQVKTGMRYVVETPYMVSLQKTVVDITERLLANKVINEYIISKKILNSNF